MSMYGTSELLQSLRLHYQQWIRMPYPLFLQSPTTRQPPHDTSLSSSPSTTKHHGDHITIQIDTDLPAYQSPVGPRFIDRASSTEVSERPSISELWQWYLTNGCGIFIFIASVVTTLLLIYIGKQGIGAAFTASIWVLTAGSLLVVCIKSYIWERPR